MTKEPVGVLLNEIFKNLKKYMDKYMNKRGVHYEHFQGAILEKDRVIISNTMNSLDGGHFFVLKRTEEGGVIEPGTLPIDCSIAQGVAGMLVQILNDPKAEPEQQWSNVWKGNLKEVE